jgi:hypothetical protein
MDSNLGPHHLKGALYQAEPLFYHNHYVGDRGRNPSQPYCSHSVPTLDAKTNTVRQTSEPMLGKNDTVTEPQSSCNLD